MRYNKALQAGFFIPIIFWITTIISGFGYGEYNHLSDMVSSLGEVGVESQYIFLAGLVITSITSLVFFIGLIKVCRKNGLNILPVVILLAYSFSIFCAAVFPLPYRLHGILGSPSIIIVLSPILALLFWGRGLLPGLKIFAPIAFIVMALGFLVFSQTILADYFGLRQRFFHMGWSVWFIYLAIAFIKWENQSSSERAAD